MAPSNLAEPNASDWQSIAKANDEKSMLISKKDCYRSDSHMQIQRICIRDPHFDKIERRLVGRGRLELPTSRLSGVRSNHLSYRPIRAVARVLFLKRYEDGSVRYLESFVCFPAKCFMSKRTSSNAARNILRKEVIQPQVPLRLPCYDFTPVTDPTVVACLLAVSAAPSGRTNSHGVTGGVYKARERIHRGMLFRDY